MDPNGWRLMVVGDDQGGNVGRFITRARDPRAGRAGARAELPPPWEAVGEALASDPTCRADGTRHTCAVAGQVLAGDGVPLTEALDALRATSRVVAGREPPYDALRAVGAGWSEATLGFLSEVTCEDPLTGLASLPHLRSRIGELYRDEALTGGTVRDHHALLVLDTPAPGRGEVFGAALRTARLADTVRTAFPGGSTAGRIGRERVAVLVRRDALLERRMMLVRALLAAVTPAARVWAESLPPDGASAATLLDGLARP